MKEQIESIKQTAIEEIAKAEDLQTLENARVKYLGKKGELTAVLRGMGGLSPEERPVIGGLVKEAKESLEKLIDEKEEKFKIEELNKKLEAEKIDITLPSTKMKRGSLHPVSRIIEDIEDLFVSMGYDVVTGPELENDEYCFERLNLPKKFDMSKCKIPIAPLALFNFSIVFEINVEFSSCSSYVLSL